MTDGILLDDEFFEELIKMSKSEQQNIASEEIFHTDSMQMVEAYTEWLKKSGYNPKEINSYAGVMSYANEKSEEHLLLVIKNPKEFVESFNSVKKYLILEYPKSKVEFALRSFLEFRNQFY